MNIKNSPIIILIILMLSGCQNEVKPDNKTVKEKVVAAFVEREPLVAESYLKILPKVSSGEKISFNGRLMNLGDLLRYSLPKDIRISKMDEMVDFNTKIQVRAKDLTLDEYLKVVFNQTDYEYDFDADKRTLNIYFMQQKTWHLAAFTTTIDTSGSMGADGLTSKSSKNVDKWTSIINASKTILNLQSDTDSMINKIGNSYEKNPQEFNIKDASNAMKGASKQPKKEEVMLSRNNRIGGEWLIEDRNMATLTVYASAKKVKRLDNYIAKQKALAKTQIKMEIKAFEVSLSKDNSTGINWDLFDERNVLERDYITGQVKSNNGIATALSVLGENQMGLQIAGRIKGVGIKAIMNFLEKQGEVHLVTEPTVTVLNGGSAFLSSGEKITYNAGFETLSVEGSSQPIIYPKTEQADIGTKIVLTPNITDDGNVMIDVLATLISLKSMNTTTLSIGTIDKPELGVQEISTQVMAKNNESIRLGGLIIHRLVTSATEADIDNKLLSSPFNSGSDRLEKRELIIIITPKIIY